MRIIGLRVCALAGLATACVAAIAAPSRTVAVHAAARGYRAVPVRVLLSPPAGIRTAVVSLGSRSVEAQCEPAGDKLAVTWIVRDLKKGERRSYRVTFGPAKASAVRHSVRRAGQNVDVMLGGQLFARYDATTGPNKPYFHPVYAPGRRLVVRGYPVATRPGETSDHIHHRGLWFTHGSVNGEDYWAETQSRTVNTGYQGLVGGPIYAAFTATTDWISKEGKRIAQDTREVTAYDLDGCRILDISITMKPVGEALVFGDTKEGSFGLRLADSMRLRGGDGHIVNSEGLTDGATWGKRAAWVDYSGTVDGATVGVAILEHPSSFRHPTYWHVRDYGLFTANPFGMHDFEQGMSANAGVHTVPVGGSLELRYRVLVHMGAAKDAAIAERWAEYADPPRVTVR